MTSAQLFWEGVELMLYGMGSVFAFLVLLIFCVRLMSFCVARLVPAGSDEPVRVAAAAAAPAGVSDDELQAIRLAIHQHRARRG